MLLKNSNDTIGNRTRDLSVCSPEKGLERKARRNVKGNGKGKSKGKDRPRTGHEGQGRSRGNSCTLSLTSVLRLSGWSTPRPGRFTPGKDTVPIV